MLLGVLVAGSLSLGLAGSAQAAAPGQVCQVNTYAPGWSIFPSGSPSYTVWYPSWVRIVDYYGPNHYWARGNGQPNGALLRVAVNQGTCHY